jgi:hypothetical protein
MINSYGNLTILVHVYYCCPICFEPPSGFDILRYFTIFPVSCVSFLIHFSFCESFRENFRYFRNFSSKSKNKFSRNFREKTKIFVSILIYKISLEDGDPKDTQILIFYDKFGTNNTVQSTCMHGAPKRLPAFGAYTFLTVIKTYMVWNLDFLNRWR